jgi:O-antigen/teichoic acid export membrane protein
MLSTAEFATLTAALAVATILTAALDMGSQTLLTRDGVAGPGERGGLLRALALARAPAVAAVMLAAILIGVEIGRPLEAFATALLAIAGAFQLSLTGALRSAQDLRPEAVAKLACGAITIGAAAVVAFLAPRATAMLLALAAATALGTLVLLRPARTALHRGPAVNPWSAARRAAPLGAMALATLVYYRAGPIALSAFSNAFQTALFGAASTVAFGLLCISNAVTTGMLPRLAAAGTEERVAITRRALLWVSGLALGLGILVALFARPLLALLFGARYGAAAGPLLLLTAATVLIAPTGVLGTALVAAGRVRPLVIQVGASLALNLALLVLLAPALGAWGAATATFACETVALIMVAASARAALPGLLPRAGRTGSRPAVISEGVR